MIELLSYPPGVLKVFYLAMILICSDDGKCINYVDKLGSVDTKAECQIRIKMLRRRLVQEDLEATGNPPYNIYFKCHPIKEEIMSASNKREWRGYE